MAKTKGPIDGAPDGTDVLEKVKRAESEAKAKVEGAVAEGESIKADARTKVEQIATEAEATASRLRDDILREGRAETERELARTREDAAEGAERVRKQKTKRVEPKKVLVAVLKV